jgi:hypothetical protein
MVVAGMQHLDYRNFEAPEPFTDAINDEIALEQGPQE